MNKTKSKVLSLVLASAMIVSSFSSLNFASAATRTENGKLTIANSSYLNSDDELNLVSGDQRVGDINIEELLGSITLETNDHEEVSDAEFDKLSHVKGDKILTVEKDGDDYKLVVKANAEGMEIVNIRYEGTYTRDDDKEYTVRGNKDITVYCDKTGEVFLGEAGKYTTIGGTGDRPGDIDDAAVNQKYLDAEAYYAIPNGTTGVDKVVAKYRALDLTNVAKNATAARADDLMYTRTVTKNNVDKVVLDDDNIELKNSKSFKEILLAGASGLDDLDASDRRDANLVDKYGAPLHSNAVGVMPTTPSVIRLVTDFKPTQLYTAADEAANANHKEDSKKADAKLTSVGNNTLEIKLGKIALDKDHNYALKVVGTMNYFEDVDGSKKDHKVEVSKKYDADIDLTTGEKFTHDNSSNNFEVNKKKGKTYIASSGTDWDSNDSFNDALDDVDYPVSVSGYKIVTDGSVTVKGGTIGDLEALTSIKVEDGTVGSLKSNKTEVEDGSVETIKQKTLNGNQPTILVSGGKVKNIDADDANVKIDGGNISGDVVVDTISIDADDDDINTVIGGNVDADNDLANGNGASISLDATSDATVTVKGTLKGENGDIELQGENVTLGNIDLDYENNVVMDDFTGTVKGIINAGDDSTLEANGDTNVTIGGKLTVDSVEIEEDAKVAVSDADVGSISGDGQFSFVAGKMNSEGGIDTATKLVITDGLVVGATAFTTDEGAVDAQDLNTLGFTLETKSANSTTDKHIIKSVKFAGVKFDKTALRIAKGQTETLTVANYPVGTALPEGYSVEWNVDVNDDYITVTTEGNVATVKAVDYNTNRAVDNQGTISASVVDKDGYEVEDLLVASINVTAIEKPDSSVTVDTKTATIGTGAVYQYIAKSSTGAVLTAASSDTQIATVELFNAADPRGYKFQVKGLAVGTATITTTDANGATATMTVNVTKVNGTLKADTTSYTFAPGKAYDVKFSTTGTTAVPVVTVNGKVVSIAPRGNGVYRVTAQNPGTAYVVAKVGNTHVSVKFVVANGAASVGVKGNNVSNLK